MSRHLQRDLDQIKKNLLLLGSLVETAIKNALIAFNECRPELAQNVIAEEKQIDENFIRKMIGIADRTKILDLLNLIFQGEQKKSIDQLRAMVDQGIEPNNFLNDLLEKNKNVDLALGLVKPKIFWKDLLIF